MKLFDIPIQVDKQLLPDAIKFVHPDGDEDVFFVNGSEPVKVIDLTEPEA